MHGLLHPNRIAWKLIKALILFSSLVTLVTTGVQLWSEYGRDIDSIQSRFVQVERSYLDSVAENVWESDIGRLNLLVNGIIEFPDFRYATVRDNNNITITSAGLNPSETVIRKVYPLQYTFRGANLKIGEMEVTASLQDVYGRAFDRVGLILVANAIKTFLVAVFMFGVVYWLMTRHLDVMIAFAQRMDLSVDPQPLKLRRGRLAGGPDELDQLSASLNQMHEKLFGSYEKLRVFNDELEERVRERTQALSEEIEVRKLTERLLSDSEARLRDMAESGSDWMWEMGPNLRFTYLAGSVVVKGVVNRADIIGRHRSDFVSDQQEERDRWAQHLDDLENRRPFRDFLYRLPKSNGGYLDVRTSGKPIFDENGEFLGYRGIGTDISQEVAAQKRIAHAEQQLRVLSSAVEQNPSAVLITDCDGAIEYVNDKFTQTTGYTLDEVLGRNPRLLKSTHTSRETHAEMWSHMTRGQEWRGELLDIRKDGSAFWAYVTLAPVRNDAGDITHFVATHEDITNRKEAESRLHDATEQAQLASRAKTELMANMSHELRTPLNAIIGFSDSILSGVFGPLNNSKYEDYLHDIHDSGQHLLELINDILDVSAIEAGRLELRPESLDVSNIVHACIKLVQHRANANGVELNVHIERDVPGLLADERRVKQVLLNLLSNAVKFTPEQGRVTLNATKSPDGGVRFEVEDNGIGMDEAGIETAFMQFGQVDSTLSRKYEGTGLGLPLSKSLLEAHGGTLDIRSRLGHGTTVIAQFPPERSILEGRDAQTAEMKSPDANVEGESVTSVSGDDIDKKTPTVH